MVISPTVLELQQSEAQMQSDMDVLIRLLSLLYKCYVDIHFNIKNRIVYTALLISMGDYTAHKVCPQKMTDLLSLFYSSHNADVLPSLFWD